MTNTETDTNRFTLSDHFVSNTREKSTFGFNGLGELVYHRTYSA